MKIEQVLRREKHGGKDIILSRIACNGIFRVTCEDNGKLIGSAMFTDHPSAAVLADIVIYEERHRRKGIASAMLKLAKECLWVIVTGESTKKGRRLCLKHGFKTAKTTEGISFLVWNGRTNGDKKDNDAEAKQGVSGPPSCGTETGSGREGDTSGEGTGDHRTPENREPETDQEGQEDEEEVT